MSLRPEVKKNWDCFHWKYKDPWVLVVSREKNSCGQGGLKRMLLGYWGKVNATWFYCILPGAFLGTEDIELIMYGPVHQNFTMWIWNKSGHYFLSILVMSGETKKWRHQFQHEPGEGMGQYFKKEKLFEGGDGVFIVILVPCSVGSLQCNIKTWFSFSYLEKKCLVEERKDWSYTYLGLKINSHYLGRFQKVLNHL